MLVASVSPLLVSISEIVLVFDDSIMHTGAPIIYGVASSMIGGSPINDPRIDDALNWLGPNYVYCMSGFMVLST